MSNKIRVLIVEPNKEPKTEEIECTLNSFQKIVGGYIQNVQVDEDTILFCNEEGKLRGLQPNRVVGNNIICGTFFIAMHDGGEEPVSLSDEQVKKYTEMFSMKIASQSNESQDLQARFINNLNTNFTAMGLDLNLLSDSYNTEDKQYAKDVLQVMHKTFADTYGTTCIDKLDDRGCEFIYVPAVIQSTSTGNLCIGLVCIDITSSGEHWDTAFMLKNGIIFQSDPGSNEAALQERKLFGSYNYWYTPTFRGDIHVKKRNIPDEVKDMINYAVNGKPIQSMDMDDPRGDMQIGGMK